MADALHPTALRDMLDALSTQRTKKFCFMAEDELVNLYRRHGETGGGVTKVTFPPLSENLRDLISMVASRFAMKVTVLPEGDQEKQAMVEYHRNTVIPTLMFADLIPKTCALFVGASAFRTLEGEATRMHADASPAKKQKTEEDPSSPQSNAAPSKDNSGSRKPRPAQAVYRPRGAQRGNETLAAGSVPANPLSRSNDAAEAKETTEDTSAPQSEDRMEDEIEEDECGLLHDYQPFRLDLTTTRAWDELPRKRAYLELGGGSSSGGGGGGSGGGQNSARINWDGSWQLKRAGNGFVTFTVQAQSGEPSAVEVALKSEKEGEQSMLVASIDPLSKRCSIARTLNGVELAKTEGTAVTEARRGAVASPHARPQPESFWVAVRDGVVAVGSGSRVTSSSAVAVLREESPLQGVRGVGFRNVGAPLTLSRIAIGKPLCRVLASIGHLASLHAQGALHASVRSTPLPWCVRAAWCKSPSVVTWGGSYAPRAQRETSGSHPALAQLTAAWPGMRVSAADADSGWAIFPSEAEAARAIQGGLASDREVESMSEGGELSDGQSTREGGTSGVSLGLCSSASREMLVAAGLPVARERRTTSNVSASRLISQALRQSSRPGSARPGR